MKRLALTLLIVALDHLFPSQPPDHILAERQRARRQVWMEAVEISAAVRVAEYGDEDYEEWERENGWAKA